MNPWKPNIIIIGPTPPPSGGIANFVKNLLNQANLSKKYDLVFLRIGHSQTHEIILKLYLMEFYRLILYFLKLMRSNVDVVHIHTASHFSFYRAFLYLLITRSVSSSAILLHIHGGGFSEFFKNSNYFFKKFIIYALESSDEIIVTSTSWIRIIQKFSEKGIVVTAIPNGYDPTIFRYTSKLAAREKLNLPHDKKIVLTVGHLEEHKGQKYLVHAAQRIAQYRTDVKFYIIGSGSLNKILKNLIRDSNLDDTVILVGGDKSQEEIQLWMNASDVFVLPSLKEGNPTVMFEALGVGLPFIGTNVGGIPDIIISSDYGFLCEPSNYQELEKTIILSLEKNWNNEQIKTYAKQFQWDFIADQVSNLYSRHIVP